MNIGKVLRIVVAAAIIVVGVVWVFTSTREQTFSGADLSFEMSSGSVVLNNRSDEAATVTMSKTGRTSAFTVVSDGLELNERSVSEGTGSNAVNTVTFELPAGEADLRLTRGSGVTVAIEASGTVDAVVMPVSDDEARNAWLLVGAVVIVALFYISRTTGHAWLNWVRQRLSIGGAAGTEQVPTSE